MYGSILGGVAGGLLLRNFDYPLLGEAIYWVGIVGFLAIWRASSLTLFDERDRALERRASQLTLTLIAVVLVVGASFARVLSVTTAYTVPPEIRGALYAYVAVFFMFGAAYLWLRFRP